MLEKYLESVQFIKDKVTANLVTASARNTINVDDDELRRIIELVRSSIEQSAMTAANNFET